MKSSVVTIFVFILVATLATTAPLPAKEGRKMTQMKLTSPDFQQSQPIPGKFSCDGEDVNPSLRIEGVPQEAKSLALVMDDPDAPVGLWVHWVIWNIDPATTEIKASSVPAGAQQGVNSWKRNNYGGPCPPSGTHRYFFHLFALKEKLSLPASTSKQELEKAMQGKILAQCELMGTYSKKH